MKRFSYLISLFLVLFVLVACSSVTDVVTSVVTGSNEESNSNFLFVVAFQDKVGLVDAESLTSNDVTIQQGSLFTSKDLENNSKAVAFDFSSRDNLRGRDELFLLSRDENNKSYISVFDMTDANINNGEEALVAKRDVIEVDVGLARAENVTAPSSFCVTDIQNSESGRYLILLSNQRNCDESSQEKNAIDIIDLGSSLTDEPQLVFHKDLNQIVGENSKMFLDQVAESLFFLEGSGALGSLRKLSIPDFEESPVLSSLDIRNIVDIQRFRNMGTSDEQMILVGAEDYRVVTNYNDVATLESSISFGEAVEKIIPSEDSGIERFFALTNTEFIVFDTPALENDSRRSINAQDAIYVYRPLSFVYLLTDRTIYSYDALRAFDETTLDLNSYSVSALEDVQFFTWVQQSAVTVTP